MKRLCATAACAAILAACGGGTETPLRGAGGSAGDPGAGGAGGTPIAASSREVRFASAAPDRFEHVGTLQIPAHAAGEKLPAVIFAHGSGPHDRDQEVSGQLAMSFGRPIAVFAELAAALQDAGFVVLRFDKRTCGPFNGCADNGYALTSDVTIDTFVQDVEGGLAFLAEQPEVDPQRLFFLGHSKGALYAPRLLTDHEAIRAGVMLAGPFRGIDHAMRAQAQKLAEVMAAIGRPQSEIDTVTGPLFDTAEDLEALRAGTFAGTQIDGLPLDYWRSWLRIGDEAPELAKTLDRPLLVLSGDYDWNVPPEETQLWSAHFGEGSIHRTQILPCVTHALNCIAQPDWMRIGPDDIGTSVDPRVLDAVVSFLSAHR